MREDADDFMVARHLEAYLLWLFGWVMFCSSQGDSCPKQLIPLARSIADAPLHEMPQFSWGSAVLAASYRGLCTGVTKVSAEEPILVGCPLLLPKFATGPDMPCHVFCALNCVDHYLICVQCLNGDCFYCFYCLYWPIYANGVVIASV